MIPLCLDTAMLLYWFPSVANKYRQVKTDLEKITNRSLKTCLLSALTAGWLHYNLQEVQSVPENEVNTTIQMLDLNTPGNTLPSLPTDLLFLTFRPYYHLGQTRTISHLILRIIRLMPHGCTRLLYQFICSFILWCDWYDVYMAATASEPFKITYFRFWTFTN